MRDQETDWPADQLEPDIRHELRNPLNAILGYGQLLAMDDLTANQREAVEEIMAAGERLLSLIERHLGSDGY